MFGLQGWIAEGLALRDPLVPPATTVVSSLCHGVRSLQAGRGSRQATPPRAPPTVTQVRTGFWLGPPCLGFTILSL